MKTGISLNVRETSQETVEKAIEAERLGLDYVWIADSPLERYPPVVAARVASKTSKIRIGLGLLSPFVHTPSKIADSLSTLIHTFGGRFDLCLGPGDVHHISRFGIKIPSRPAESLLEARREIGKQLRDDSVKFWLGAQGPSLLKIAKKFDGVFLNFSSFRMITWAKRMIGRTTKRFHVGLWSPSYVYSNLDRGIQNTLHAAAGLVALGASDYLLKEFGLREPLRAYIEKVRLDHRPELYVNSLPEETTVDFRINLEADALRGYIAELERLGVSALVFGYPQSLSIETVRDLGSALSPGELNSGYE